MKCFLDPSMFSQMAGFLSYGRVVFHCVYTHRHSPPLFPIHSSINGHVGWFHFVTVVNTATVNVGVRIPFWVGVFICFEQPELKLLGPYGKSILNFLRNLYTSFHSGCTKLNSHPRSTNVSFPHPFQSLSLVLIAAILMHVGW